MQKSYRDCKKVQRVQNGIETTFFTLYTFKECEMYDLEIKKELEELL